MDDRQQTPSDTSEAITDVSITWDVVSLSMAPRTCLAKTISRRVGPIYVAFQLPTSNAGAQFDFQGGRAYRHSDDTCYIVGWSDHSFVCDAENQDFLQLSGGWPVSTLIPQDCADGGGAMENQLQANLMVSNNMPLSCSATAIDVHNGPLHIRFSLPEARNALNNLYFAGGSVGRKISGRCYQIEWSNLVLTCDQVTYQWNQTSGLWRTPEEPFGCADWVEGVQQSSNAEQDFLQVVDTTGSSPCQAALVEHTSGPIKVAFQLPGNHIPGTTVAYESGQVVRWFNSTCHNLLWTNHLYMCDVYTSKWILESGDFADFPSDPRYCDGQNGGYILNGDQPNLMVVDLTQTDAPTAAPYQKIRPILTGSPSFSPTYTPNLILRPIESDVPQVQTATNSVPGWPTFAPLTVVKPIETIDPYPTFAAGSVGALYVLSGPPTGRHETSPIVPTFNPQTGYPAENSPPPEATNPPSSKPSSTVSSMEMHETSPTAPTFNPVMGYPAENSPQPAATNPPSSKPLPTVSSMEKHETSPIAPSFNPRTGYPAENSPLPVATNPPSPKRSPKASSPKVSSKERHEMSPIAPTFNPRTGYPKENLPPPTATSPPSPKNSMSSTERHETSPIVPTSNPMMGYPAENLPPQAATNPPFSKPSPTVSSTERHETSPIAHTFNPTTGYPAENSPPAAATNPPSPKPSPTPSSMSMDYRPDTSVPTASRAPSHPNSDTIPYYCGCPSCTQAVWTTDADSFTCGERIEYIVISMGGALLDACRLIAGQEFPLSCGPFCDPDVCHTIVVDNSTADSYNDGTGQPSMATMQPTLAPSQQSSGVLASSIPATASPSPGFTENVRLPASSDTEDSTTNVNIKPGISAGLLSMSSTQPMESNADAITIVPGQAQTTSATSVVDVDGETPHLRIVSAAYFSPYSRFAGRVTLVSALASSVFLLDL